MPGRLARDIKQSKPFSSPILEVYFNLLRTTDELSRATAHLLKPYDLSETQYNVLRILRGAGADGLPCSEIGARLLTHDPDVTRLVDRLERRELVARTREQRDRRVVTVRISAGGLALLEDCDLDRHVAATLTPRFAQLSSDNQQNLIHFLELLRESPTDHGA
jgi:MarR family transcriptional regulator, organic hydroperoxide resistance regulator